RQKQKAAVDRTDRPGRLAGRPRLPADDPLRFALREAGLHCTHKHGRYSTALYDHWADGYLLSNVVRRTATASSLDRRAWHANGAGDWSDRSDPRARRTARSAANHCRGADAGRGRTRNQTLKHDPEKCEAVFRKDHAQTKTQSAMPIRSNLIAL